MTNFPSVIPIPPSKRRLLTREESRQELIDKLTAANAWIDRHGMPGEYTATGWIPPEEPVDYYVQWVATIRVAGWAKMIHWNLGDMLNYNERVYGETYAQIADSTGFSRNILYRDAWICNAIPYEIRRHPDDVSFSTHLIVAGEKYPVAVKDRWLGVCAEKKLTGEQLKEELRNDGRSAPGSSADRTLSASQPEDSIWQDRIDARAEGQETEKVGANPANQEVVVRVSADGQREVYCPHCGALFRIKGRQDDQRK